MSKTPEEAYGQLKHLTSRAIELSRAGNLNELGPTLSRMEETYKTIQSQDPYLKTIQATAREFGEGPLAIRVLAYSADTNILAAEAHLAAAENALEAGDMDAARNAYAQIAPGADLRKYVNARPFKKHDLKTRAEALDEKFAV
ncbi:hypothetical protein GF343_01380 [Candidatus Woesearchaeota archaeon]|nr:hypothetical protein [Candidatus Woesearchaeota archaeon]